MILGLTGGIASGKSTVSKIMKKKGIYVVDADKISREISDSLEVTEKVREKLGEEAVLNGKLNRKKLRSLIFEDEEKRKILNNIMHPIIIGKLEEEIKNNKKEKIIVLDIPLLFETKLEYLCDKVLVVWTDEETQIRRIMQRDKINEELSRKILSSQMPLSEKLKLADYTIENNKTIEELEKKVYGII